MSSQTFIFNTNKNPKTKFVAPGIKLRFISDSALNKLYKTYLGILFLICFQAVREILESHLLLKSFHTILLTDFFSLLVSYCSIVASIIGGS